MQIKTTMRYHYTPIEWWKSITPDAGKDVKQQKLSYIASGNAKWFSHFGRQFGCFLKS